MFYFAPVSVLALIVFIGGFRLNPNIFLAKFYQFNHGMCMVDVFVLGIVVSLIKLTALADVTFYVGFYTTFIFSVLMIVDLIETYEPVKGADKLFPHRQYKQHKKYPKKGASRWQR